MVMSKYSIAYFEQMQYFLKIFYGVDVSLELIMDTILMNEPSVGLEILATELSRRTKSNDESKS